MRNGVLRGLAVLGGDTLARGHRYAGSITRALPVRHITAGWGGGSSSSRQSGVTTQTGRELSDEERALLDTQNKMLKIELQQITRQNNALKEIFPQVSELLKAITLQAGHAVEVYAEALQSLRETPGERALRGQSEQNALAILRGEAPVVSKEEQDLLDTIFETERQRGMRDITQFAQDAAGARGLKLTDTPIGQEAIEGVQRFQEGLGAEKARTTLAVGAEGRQFREAVRQFQEGLRFTAQQNRLALTGQSPFAMQGPISTVTAGQGAANATGALAALLNRPTDQQGTQWGRSAWDTWNAGLNLFGGISTVRAKKDIIPLDPEERGARGVPIGDAYDKALAKLNATPLFRYRYKWEGKETARAPHIGPILELSPEEIRETPLTVNLLDYIGLTHAGVKAVDRKVERLRRVLPVTTSTAGQRRALPMEVAP